MNMKLQKQQSMAAAAEASIKDDNINGTSSSSNYCNNRSSSSSAPLMQLQHHHHHHQRPNTTPICRKNIIEQFKTSENPPIIYIYICLLVVVAHAYNSIIFAFNAYALCVYTT